jgi:hypothetical protein
MFGDYGFLPIITMFRRADVSEAIVEVKRSAEWRATYAGTVAVVCINSYNLNACLFQAVINAYIKVYSARMIRGNRIREVRMPRSGLANNYKQNRSAIVR